MPQFLYMSMLRTILFLCVCFSVSARLEKKKFCNEVLGGTGSTREDFYTGTRNESKYKV